MLNKNAAKNFKFALPIKTLRESILNPRGFYAYGGIFRDVELQQLPAGPLIEWVGVDTLDYKTGALQVKIKSVPGRQTLE